jgi:hypothetical protein
MQKEKGERRARKRENGEGKAAREPTLFYHDD